MRSHGLIVRQRRIDIKKTQILLRLLGLRIKPHIIEKKFSGPLNSFKKNTLEWEESTLETNGGSENIIKVACQSVELSRVIKGNNVSVFTGAIIVGCDIELLNNEKIIYKKQKIFPKEITLNSLNNTPDSSF